MAEFFLLERELLQAAERSLQLPAEERIALADKLADAAMMHLRRSQESLTAWRKRLATAEVEIDWRAHLHPSARPVISSGASSAAKGLSEVALH
jgi:hypothetical protein